MTRDANSRLRIIVLGVVVRTPIAGMAWSDLHYLLGLRALGHDVLYLERSDDYPSCYDPTQNAFVADASYGVAFAERTFARTGLDDAWCYDDRHSGRTFGHGAPRAAEFVESADVVLNLGGTTPLDELAERPVRVFVDKDPCFTQIRHLQDEDLRERALAHNTFFSFAENIGRDDCSVPDDGLPWRATRHPIFLDSWRVAPPRPSAAFTTVMQWESYPPRAHDGRRYGTKAESFPEYLDLPRRCRETLEVATGSTAAPRGVLQEHGWHVLNPMLEHPETIDYMRYIESSKAEFSVAKTAYVETRSGWFSDRSAAYLATGRPVVTQDTAFDSWLPTGEGVLAFSTADEAVVAVDDVSRAYERHREAARDLAVTYFEARRVLSTLLETAVAFA